MQATVPLYIRFGDLPPDGQSKVHRSDQIIRNEGGVSVWKACEANGRYYPLLPEHPNENTLADYFRYLLHSNDNVYLVTGTEIFIEGADREPILMDPIIIKDITYQYHQDISKYMDKNKFESILSELQELRKFRKDYEKNSTEEIKPRRRDKIKIVEGMHSKYKDCTATIMDIHPYNATEFLYQVALSIMDSEYMYDKSTWVTLERGEFEVIERGTVSDEELQQYSNNESYDGLEINDRVKIISNKLVANHTGTFVGIDINDDEILYGVMVDNDGLDKPEPIYFQRYELEKI